MKLKELIDESDTIAEWCHNLSNKAELYNLIDKVIYECTVVVYSAMNHRLPESAYASLIKEELGMNDV